MILYILRHGEAEDPSSKYKEFERPLTSNGKKEIKHLAKFMKHLHVTFDFIITSPYVRAHQTAEIIADAYNMDARFIPSSNLLPECNLEEIIDEINSTYPNINSLLLVGHNPHLTQLVSILTTGESSSAVFLKKGMLCKVTTLANLFFGKCALLNWLLASDELNHM